MTILDVMKALSDFLSSALGQGWGWALALLIQKAHLERKPSKKEKAVIVHCGEAFGKTISHNLVM